MFHPIPLAALSCWASHPSSFAAGTFGNVHHVCSICSLGAGDLGEGGIKTAPREHGGQGLVESRVNRRRVCGEQEGSRGGPLRGECLGEMPAARVPGKGKRCSLNMRQGFTMVSLKSRRTTGAKQLSWRIYEISRLTLEFRYFISLVLKYAFIFF